MGTPRSRRASLLPLAMILFVGISPTLVMAAYASSGWVYRQQVVAGMYGPRRVCLEAAVDTTSAPYYNYGSIRVANTTGALCDGNSGVGVGYIGVTIDGYRSGAFCGTSYYNYSSTFDSEIGYGYSLCTNPAGSQSFHTNVFGRVYNGSTYTNIPGISSPAQNG